MRDVLLGCLSYVLGIGALIGTMVLCHYLLAPPIADRTRSFAFSGGGGALTVALVLLLVIGLMVYASARTVR